MNRRGHVFYEWWVLLIVTLVLLALALPYLVRGRWLAGGLYLSPLAVLLAFFAVRGRMRGGG